MKWICILTGLFSFYSAQSQYYVSGKVADSSGSLQGATITLKGASNVSVLSGAEGTFYIKNLQVGIYELSTTYSGYQASTQSVKIDGNKNFEIVLTALHNALQPVEIKSIRASERAPFAKTNLNKSYIEKNNLGQDIPFLLNQTPNVVINSDAGNGIGYTAIHIRGTDASRINMTINGIPYNDAESQGTYFVDLPDFLSSVTSVQVQRGVGTSSNGAGAFGASMNFSTHEYNEKAYGEINNSYGSFNSYKNTIKLGSGLIGKHFTIDARLSNIHSDGYVERAKSDLQGAYINAAWWGKTSSLKFTAMLGKEKTYQAWYGITGEDLKNNRRLNYAGTEKPGDPYNNQTDNYWQNHYQLIYNKQFVNNLSFNTAFYLSTGKGYYEEYKADKTLADYNINPIIKGTDTTYSSDLVRRLWLNNRLFGQVFSFQKQSGKNVISVGGGWSVYPGRHYGEVTWTAADPNARSKYYDLDARKEDANIYVKWQHNISKEWITFADMQYRYAHYRIDGFKDNPTVRINETWNFVNPKAGISYQHKDWSGFFSYALGNKEPNRDDFEAGKTQLPKREQLNDFELNVTKRNLLPNLTLAATFYYMYYRDQLVLTGKINDVGAYTRTNIPESYRAGVELESQYHIRKFAINYNISLSSNKLMHFVEYIDDYDNGGQVAINHGNPNISFSPSIVQQATASYNLFKNAQVEWMAKHVGRQYLDNSSDKAKSLEAYFVNDARFSYNIPTKKLLKDIRLILQVNNIFSVKYQPNGYTYSYIYGQQLTTENYYFPMAGRNFMAAINIRF